MTTGPNKFFCLPPILTKVKEELYCQTFATNLYQGDEQIGSCDRNSLYFKVNGVGSESYTFTIYLKNKKENAWKL